jgi:DNA-binding LytR/AlgR family response regulator
VSTLAFPDAAPISAVIADDEAQLASYLEKLLQGCWPQLEIVGRAGNGEQALQLIRSLRPDVAFLDIRMPGLTGLEVAERLAAERSPGAAAACRIVFVTAYDQYAIEAFERAAVDYLLKPVTAERLAGTVARLRTAPTAPATADASLGELRRLIGALRQAPPRLHWLQVGVRDEVALLPVAEVDLFQSSDKYTLAIGVGGEWLLRTALKDLEPQLDPNAFWRIHRGAVVRVGAIARVHRDLRGQLKVQLKGHARELAVSRPYAHQFRAL